MINTKKRKLQKLLLLILMLVVIGMLFFFFREIIIPFIKAEINKQYDEAKTLLNDAGIVGMIAVTLIEGLQMVVVFIPAEFIQMSSGMAYPMWLTVILLDFGVMFGASIIWVLVHTFKFDKDLFQNATNKIEKYAKKAKNTQLLMYLLFFMPIIPFGAICYYGSSSKIKYPRYILTCATGVLPSIITSIFMGRALKEFISDSIPLVWLIIIIVGLALLLFIFIFILLNHFIFKQNKGTPEHPFYSFMNFLLKIVRRNGRNFKFKGQEELAKIKDQTFVCLSNHCGEYDFYRGYKAVGVPLANVANRHILNNKVFKKPSKLAGFIPKRLFDKDLETIIKIKKMLKDNYSVYICPEGRLSIDGTNYPYVGKLARFVKSLHTNIVILNIQGGYLAEGKWQKRWYFTPILCEIKSVLTAHEINALDDDTLENHLKENLSYNDFTYSKDLNVYKMKNKALNLEHVLYMCPKCHQRYQMATKNNTLYCKHCGFEVTLQNNMWFDNNEYPNIHEYYQEIKRLEKPSLKDLHLETNVDVKIFNKDNNKYEKDEGLCTLTNQTISFKSTKRDYYIEKDLKELFGLAFGVNEEFEFYDNERLHYFYPKENKTMCTRWALLVDLINEE